MGTLALCQMSLFASRLHFGCADCFMGGPSADHGMKPYAPLATGRGNTGQLNSDMAMTLYSQLSSASWKHTFFVS